MELITATMCLPQTDFEHKHLIYTILKHAIQIRSIYEFFLKDEFGRV